MNHDEVTIDHIINVSKVYDVMLFRNDNDSMSGKAFFDDEKSACKFAYHAMKSGLYHHAKVWLHSVDGSKVIHEYRRHPYYGFDLTVKKCHIRHDGAVM